MKRLILLSFLAIGLTTSCSKIENLRGKVKNPEGFKGEAKVIGFTPEKCGCCWGWSIAIKDDTIKSDDSRLGAIVGYKITKPLKVQIEIGNLEDCCSNLGIEKPEYARDYYEIRKIKKIK